MSELKRNCPICKNSSGENLYFMQFSLPKNIVADNYNIVNCEHCGFIFADTPSSQGDYNNFYKTMSIYNTQQSSGSGVREFEQERFLGIIDVVNKFINPEGSILDIGCGKGGLIKEFKNHGFKNVKGLEPSFSDDNIMQGDIFSDLTKQYDFVILSHVLEHIVDLQRAVSSLKKMSKNYVYIELPDASRYSEFNKVPFYYFDIEHINHFDRESLVNMMDGFELVYFRQKTIKASADEDYPVISAVFKICHSEEHSDVGISRDPHVGLCPPLDDEPLKTKILNYIEKSKENSDYAILKELAKTQEEIIVWGAGSFTSRLMGYSSLKNCNIKYFIDNNENKQDSYIEGVLITSAKRALNGFYGKIVLTSVLFADEIKDQIEKINNNEGSEKRELIILNDKNT